MQELLNDNKLKDKKIPENKRLKTTLYVPKQTYKKIDSCKSLAELNSRNDVIEKAVDFYFAYLSSELSQEFLCGVYGRKVDGAISNIANRFARMLFKQAVELDIITRLLSSDYEISKEAYTQLRKAAVESVKKNNGSIDVYNATKE